ncbi:MAG: DNA polymerase III subunit delta [Patescibacteria group bacterium]
MIIFLYGADSFRSKRLLQEMKNKFIKDADQGSDSLDVVDGQTADAKEINEKINTGSLFTKKRMVIIEDVFKNKKTQIFAELIFCLKKVENDEDKVIILRDGELNEKGSMLKGEAKKLFTFLIKQKYVQEFKILKDTSLLSFIKKEAELYGKEIGMPAGVEIIKRTGGNLWLIAQGLKKAALMNEEKNISVAAIKEMTAEIFEEDIFALTDALGAKNKKLALRILEEQYSAGASDEYLIAMLIRQFKILLQINEALNSRLTPDSIASKLKIHPFVAKKGISQAKNFSREKLLSYLDKLISLDFGNKTGRGNARVELTMLIAEI